MKANHTSQKYHLEDNITKNYPQQIAALKERVNGMQADIEMFAANHPKAEGQAEKDVPFAMKVGDRMYTDRKEAGAALTEMCKELKAANNTATIGEYAGFKMAVTFDSLKHVFVMNLKGALSHNIEIGSDAFGNITRINNALEAMPRQLEEAKSKLTNVEHQLAVAKTEVEKPFAQETELAEKLERLTALNALLNMDEKGDEGIVMDDEDTEPAAEHKGEEVPQKESIRDKLESMKEKIVSINYTTPPMPQKRVGEVL